MNRNLLPACLFWMLVFAPIAGAEANWLSQAVLDASGTGLIEAVLPPELHRTPTEAGTGSRPNDQIDYQRPGLEDKTGNRIGNLFRQKMRLDLQLTGPDGKTRAFELFWGRPSGFISRSLIATKAELLPDRRLLWETDLPADIEAKEVHAIVTADSFAGKVEVEGLAGEGWMKIAENVAFTRESGLCSARIVLPPERIKSLRLIFSGFDQTFTPTPVFVQTVRLDGKTIERGFATASFSPPIRTATVDDALEIRADLPGSGLFIESIEITTQALFQGTWQVGNEKVRFGTSSFVGHHSGPAGLSPNALRTVTIPMARRWDNRALIVRLQSSEYFGRIEQCRFHVRLPRLLLLADLPGAYTAQTGLEKPVPILSGKDETRDVQVSEQVFHSFAVNPAWQTREVTGFALKGGPFSPEGYAWKGDISVPAPDFYRLTLNEKAALEQNRPGIRLVLDQTQIPFFWGPQERREMPLPAAGTYHRESNSSEMLLTLPGRSPRFEAIQLKAQGVFERTLVFEKHVPGLVGWQPWLTRSWRNSHPGEAIFTVSLAGFPEDQHEIRLLIEHGNNQPLEIKSFSILYQSQDLFFFAPEAGTYSLAGGHPTAPAPSYDLGIVLDRLVNLVPVKLSLGEIQSFGHKEPGDIADDPKGGPFVSTGYRWLAPFTVTAPGFHQLSLSRTAALEKNRKGFRVIRNQRQIPYFAGSTSDKSVEMKFSEAYEESANRTVWGLTLPCSSPFWTALDLSARGVFSRVLKVELRKPGKLGWKVWKTVTWTHREGSSEAHHTISLADLPEGETELRLSMDHGDNNPLKLSGIHARYSTQDLFFFATEAGEYHLAGGNDGARAASYDLALIRNHLTKTEPRKVSIGEAADFAGGSGVTSTVQKAFSEQGWGLYFVLGLITGILLLLIVKLFPEERPPTQPTQDPPPSSPAPEK